VAGSLFGTLKRSMSAARAGHVRRRSAARPPSKHSAVKPGALANSPSIFSTALVILLVPIAGGAWEEPGWRGYALPRLLTRRSALEAGLVLGALWALWHVPLFLTGKQHWSDLMLVLVVSVFVTWLFQNALYSVLVTMVFHATNNAFSGGYVSLMFHGSDSVRQSWMLVVVWGTVAVLVAVFAKSFRRAR